MYEDKYRQGDVLFLVVWVYVQVVFMCHAIFTNEVAYILPTEKQFYHPEVSLTNCSPWQ